MDDSLVERWQGGDDVARVAVRNGIRGIAERMLGHPGLHRALGRNSGSVLLVEDSRREVTAGISAEVMKRGAPNGAQLTAMALIVSGRRAIEELQLGRAVAEEAHLPPQSVVTYALAERGMSVRVRQAVEGHLSKCGACSDDVRILRNVVRNQEAAGEDLGEVDAEFVREAREAAPDLGPLLAGQIREAEEAATAEIAAEAVKRLTSKPTGPRMKVQRDRRKTERPGTLRLLFPVFVLLAAMAGLWWVTSGSEQMEAQADARYRKIADRNPPTVRRVSALPDGADSAVDALVSGDCITAAGLLRGIRRRSPDVARLYTLEGAAWLCAGNGQKGIAVLDELEARGGELPRSFHWTRGQLHLLEGDGHAALLDLTEAQLRDPTHRDQAGAQIGRIRAIRDS